MSCKDQKRPVQVVPLAPDQKRKWRHYRFLIICQSAFQDKLRGHFSGSPAVSHGGDRPFPFFAGCYREVTGGAPFEARAGLRIVSQGNHARALSSGGQPGKSLHTGYIEGDVSPVCFGFVFRDHLFSTTSLALFLGLFWVCFCSPLMFSTTSPLCFWLCLGLFLVAKHLLSTTSPLCFLK